MQDQPAISIIIPAYNEEKNVELLLSRLATACLQNHVVYELIVIDDRSTDQTSLIAEKYSSVLPVNVKTKIGIKGKAQSILEGVKYSKYEYVCIIDADLQYPPEAIPPMLRKCMNGFDIVIGNRSSYKGGIIRKLVSAVYSNIFNKFLHHLDFDVQSGIKVFKRDILNRFTLNPTPWTFDLEFLLRARDAGYSIGSYDIVFSKRYTGKSKIGLLSGSLEIGWSALKLKFLKSRVIPFSKLMIGNQGIGFHYKGKKFIPHTTLPLSKSAFKSLTKKQKKIIISLFLIFASGIFINWHVTLVATISLLTVLYLSDFAFNLFLIYRSLSRSQILQVSEQELLEAGEDAWVPYTILSPLYKEWQVLPQFVRAIESLDYPKEKLQVILLLEENDKKTIEKVAEFKLPFYFEVVVVPESNPKTKPKALNYGLSFSKGDQLVVYDAEDIPEPLQLKKAVLAFKKAHPKTGCVQAKLNFFNPNQNILTRLFTAEYSLWFDLILPGLQSLYAPLPLGGTSNHFKVKDILKLEGWDAFNVTEDCDLGLRLFQERYYTQIFNSTTYEEANSNLVNWIHQRSRWIKGYIQTYFVHSKNLSRFFDHPDSKHILTFQLIIGGKIVTTLLNPLMWIITLCYFLFRHQLGHFIESFYIAPVFYLGVFSFIFGNFLLLCYYMIASAKREFYDLIKYCFFVPFYWIAISFAGWIAVYSFIKSPHYWAKTVHGYHLQDKSPEESEQNEDAVADLNGLSSAQTALSPNVV